MLKKFLKGNQNKEKSRKQKIWNRSNKDLVQEKPQDKGRSNSQDPNYGLGSKSNQSSLKGGQFKGDRKTLEETDNI